MDYVNSYYLFGTESKQIPIIPMYGAPTESTEGAVGLLCMDLSAEDTPIYKCVEVTADYKYIWKPFNEPLAYKKRTYILDKDLSGYTITEDGDFKIEAEELSGVEDGTPVVVEITDNGTVETQNALFYKDMCFVNANFSGLDWLNWMFTYYEDGRLHLVDNGARQNLDGVTLKIYTETVKPIDKELLPQSNVPHLVGTYELPIHLGKLGSGVYILEGDCSWLPATDFLQYFDHPTLCQMINSEGSPLRLLWFEEDDSECGICIRVLEVAEGTITQDEAIQLHTDVVTKNDLCPLITDDNHDYDEYPITGIAVKEYLNTKVFSTIALKGVDGKIYTLRVDTNGTLEVKLGY
jgi:hypothetical protein